MQTPKTARLIAVLAVVGALVACGGDDGDSASAGGASADSSGNGTDDDGDTVLRVGDQGRYLELPLDLSGELDDVPYEVEFSNFDSGPLVNEGIAAGEVDIGTMGDTPAILSVANGLDTVVVGVQQYSGPGATLVARPGSGIETLADIEGHTVAYSTGTSQHGFVLRALESVDLAEDDIEQVDVPISDVVTALADDQADVGVLYEVYRPPYIEDHPDAVELVQASELVPNWGFLISPRSTAEDSAKAAAIGDFLARLTRAAEWVTQHQDEFIQAYYVDFLHQDFETGRSVFDAEGTWEWVGASAEVRDGQQHQADLLYDAGHFPERVDLTDQYDPALTDQFTTAIQEAAQP